MMTIISIIYMPIIPINLAKWRVSRLQSVFIGIGLKYFSKAEKLQESFLSTVRLL